LQFERNNRLISEK